MFIFYENFMFRKRIFRTMIPTGVKKSLNKIRINKVI